MYEVNSLSFSYGKRQILDDVTLTFPTRKMTAIIGPNGCGKSTLLGHLSQLHPTDTITLDGVPLQTIDGPTFSRKVAVLAQMHDAMIDDFLVKDIVLMGRYPYKSHFGNYTAEDVAIAQSYMDQVGVSHLAEEEMGHLSGGERQRVFIAKALTQQTEVLLLDEPTNHLDMKYKVALMKELQNFSGTSIVVLHDLNLAARYCDHIVLMKDGNVLQTGIPQEVLTPELLEPIFEVPFHVSMENGVYHLYY